MSYSVPFLGNSLQLQFQQGRRRVARFDNTLYVPASHFSPALERWYRTAARREIALRLEEATAVLGVEYQRLAIRDQRTRWGSCSSRGTLSFNWRLVLGETHALDYVVWHEACHLLVPNHSHHFWELLKDVYPEYLVGKHWLHHHGHELLIFCFDLATRTSHGDITC